jgi:hypothetical protein
VCYSLCAGCKVSPTPENSHLRHAPQRDQQTQQRVPAAAGALLYGPYYPRELAYLLACFVRALKALSLHLKRVLLAFCHVLLAWPTPKRILLRPRSFAARGGAIPVRSPPANEVSRRVSPHESHSPVGAKYHVALAALAKWWCCLFFDWRWSCCEEAESRLGVSVSHLPNAYRNVRPPCVMSSPAASAKGKDKAKPAFKSKRIIALGWLVSNK